MLKQLIRFQANNGEPILVDVDSISAITPRKEGVCLLYVKYSNDPFVIIADYETLEEKLTAFFGEPWDVFNCQPETEIE